MSHGEKGASSVAIVGVACRFADITGIEQFWTALKSGRELIETFSAEQARLAGADDARLADPRLVLAGGVICDADLFDAGFFSISPRDAQSTDPQHRLFLELCWQALEHAGYDPARFDGDIGVYGGASANTYLPLLREAGIEPSTPYGNDVDHLTTRVAYKLGLTGPTVTVQAGCSTSLLAVHLASQSLLNYECDLALAGAVCVVTHRRQGYLHDASGQLSPDGHSRPFDVDAAGSVPADGCGVVVLRRLEDTVDGDNVLAVIRGSAVRNDGRRKMSFSTPSTAGLEATMRAAYEAAEVDPNTIDRLEAHAIGTPLGDAIEIDAAAAVFTGGRRTLGAVKSAVGHTDTVSGLVGLLTAVEQMRNRTFLPILHFTKAADSMNLDSAGLDVVRKAAEWPDPGHPRRASVTSLTTGGTSVHVVLEEAPCVQVREHRPGAHVVPLSAKTTSALRSGMSALRDHLREHPDLPLSDIANTLQLGRAEFSSRHVIVASDVADLVAQLERSPQAPAVPVHGDHPMIEAAVPLAARFDVFRAYAAGIKEQLDPSLRAWIADGTFTGPSNGLGQAAVLVVQSGLAHLWSELGLGSLFSSSAQLGSDAVRHVLLSVGAAWCSGNSVRWQALHGDDTPRRLSLPGYAFHRARHWVGVSENDSPKMRPEELGEYVPPATDLEYALASMWAEVFGVDRVGAIDNFFSFGGDSMLAVQVALRIREGLALDVAFATVLANPTVRALAAAVGSPLLQPAGPVLGRAKRVPLQELRQIGPLR